MEEGISGAVVRVLNISRAVGTKQSRPRDAPPPCGRLLC
jgi:hypothetical protein